MLAHLPPQQQLFVNCQQMAPSTAAFESSRAPAGFLQFTPIVSEPPDLHNSGVARNVWRYRQDQSADVQFVCRTCGNSSKATGHAVFWIYKNDATNTGQIWLKLYTRRCGSASGGCGQGVAEPVWRPAEAARALDSLRDHVAEAYYGAADSAIGHRQRRQSKQKLLHTTANAVEQ
uniref:Zf-3CxxC domain-containing protein n=1 Tax=Macrostomum lignano TaxID=282301 RepID=A0A1I8GH14_9PLAT